LRPRNSESFDAYGRLPDRNKSYSIHEAHGRRAKSASPHHLTVQEGYSYILIILFIPKAVKRESSDSCRKSGIIRRSGAIFCAEGAFGVADGYGNAV